MTQRSLFVIDENMYSFSKQIIFLNLISISPPSISSLNTSASPEGLDSVHKKKLDGITSVRLYIISTYKSNVTQKRAPLRKRKIKGKGFTSHCFSFLNLHFYWRHLSKASKRNLRLFYSLRCWVRLKRSGKCFYYIKLIFNFAPNMT